MYKQDLALSNLQELICLKIQPNQTKPERRAIAEGFYCQHTTTYYKATKTYSDLCLNFCASKSYTKVRVWHKFKIWLRLGTF